MVPYYVEFYGQRHLIESFPEERHRADHRMIENIKEEKHSK